MTTLESIKDSIMKPFSRMEEEIQIAQLKKDIAALEINEKKGMHELGEYVYQMLRQAALDLNAIKEHAQYVVDYSTEIEQKQRQIQDLQAELEEKRRQQALEGKRECSSCGEIIADKTSVFCAKCGTKLPPVGCPKCGKEDNAPDVKYCSACGEKLQKDED